jgi:two-component system, OmpR family, response regulator
MQKALNKILLVEDEADIQEIARISLETIGGFSVHICSNGKEAVEQAPDIMPDLIMLDVMMPGMDGLTTLKNLRQNAKLVNIPVIFMTAKAQPGEMKHYLESGAVGAISKPFDPIKLPQEVTTIWQTVV